MAKILTIISTGFEEIEAVSVIDILRRADIEVTIATINDIITMGANGISLKADILLEDINSIEEFDMIVLPGGGENTQNLSTNELVLKYLNQMKDSNKYIGAICAAPYVLHKANVLNQNYTCYPSFEKKIREDGYQSDKMPVVIDDKVITSRGPATAIPFALEIVKTIKGEETYSKIKNGLLA